MTEDTAEIDGGNFEATPEGATISSRHVENYDPPRLDLPAGDYVVWPCRSGPTEPMRKSHA